MGRALINYIQIKKSYGNTEILNGINVSLERGKCTLLLGKNASGKSTLLKIMAGLEPPSKGQITFDGSTKDWKDCIKQIRHKIIYLHQQPYLFSGTVEANISYGLKFMSKCRKDKTEEVQKALEWSGLSNVAQQQANILSGGFQQRVAFTRAWILKPQVLLLDEPTSNMDLDSRKQVIHLLNKMKAEGTSIVITSHTPDQFQELADCYFVLNHGKLEDGTFNNLEASIARISE